MPGTEPIFEHTLGPIWVISLVTDMQFTTVNTSRNPAIGCIRMACGADDVAGRMRTCVVYRRSSVPGFGTL